MCDKLVSDGECPKCGKYISDSDTVCPRCGEKVHYLELSSDNIVVVHNSIDHGLELYTPDDSGSYYILARTLSFVGERERYERVYKFICEHKDEYIHWKLSNFDRFHFSKKYPINKVVFSIEKIDITQFQVDVDFFVNNTRVLSYPICFKLTNKHGVEGASKVFRNIIKFSLTSLSVLPKPKESTYSEYYPYRIIADFKEIIDSFEKEHPEEYSSLKLLEELEEKDNN